MPLPTCATCENWRRRNPGAHEGTCHLKPPTVVAIAYDSDGAPRAMSAWPITYADDGCRVGHIEKAPPTLQDTLSPLVSFAARLIPDDITPEAVRHLLKRQAPGPEAGRG